MERSLARQSSMKARPITPTRTGAAPNAPGTAGMRPGPLAPGRAPMPPMGLGTARGIRPPSARGGGVGLNTEVKVEHRPVTQQGMTGLRTGSQGPGRQILDKSFYLTRLRKKKQELQAEIDSMVAEMERYQKDDTKNIQLERKYESTLKEVKGLRGQLGDYNLIISKLAMDQGLDEMKAQLRVLKEKNDREKKRSNALFTERAAKEQQMKEAEAEIQNIKKSMEHRLKELAPDKRALYVELQTENNQLMSDMAKLENQLQELSRNVATLEQEIATVPLKQRMLAVWEQLQMARKKKEQMEAEDSKIQLSPEEAREAMLTKMRKDKAEMARVEAQIKEIETMLRQHEQKLDQVDDTISNEQEENADKLQAMQEKDEEMSVYISKFEGTKKEQLSAMRRTQQGIVELLERISKASALQRRLPKNRLWGMQDELQYNKKLLDSAQSDHTHLMQELEAKRDELNNMGALEENIETELKTLQERMESMRADLDKFSQVDELKGRIEAKHKDLEVAKAVATARRDALVLRLEDLVEKVEAKKRQLQDSDAYADLEKLEQKMAALEAQIYQMQDYIETKSTETNYKPLLAEVTKIVGELNTKIIESCQ